MFCTNEIPDKVGTAQHARMMFHDFSHAKLHNQFWPMHSVRQFKRKYREQPNGFELPTLLGIIYTLTRHSRPPGTLPCPFCHFPFL